MSRILMKFIHARSRLDPEKPEASPQEPKMVVAQTINWLLALQKLHGWKYRGKTRWSRRIQFSLIDLAQPQPYTPTDWDDDIKQASSHGIDGFALNIGKETWQLDQVSACFEAAERIDTDFKLFLSFDMSSLATSTQHDIQFLKTYVSKFALRPHFLRYKGKALISTFAGENALFGCNDLDSAWMLVKHALEEVCPISLIPCFFVDPRRFRSMKCLDGAFNWNGCWPTYLTPKSPKEEIRCPKLRSDVEYLRNLQQNDGHRKTYMASVSPWFFTHYGEDSWNKNWIYRCDDWLLVRRWQQLIAMRDDVDIVQIISWNDYGESHYIGPIKRAQPNSEAWVNGFDHTAWLHLCGHFSRQFKGGRNLADQQKASIGGNEDRIYIWARPHPHNVKAYADPVGRPTNWELTDDVFWVVVFALAPARVLLWSAEEEIPSSLLGQNPKADAHNISAGLSLLSCPLAQNGGIHVQLVRNGDTVLNFHPDEFVFELRPKTYNFNAYVATYPSLV